MGERDGRFSLLLIDPDTSLVEAWREEFAAYRGVVEAHHGVVEDRLGEFDAFISPGNSYGQMDGGVDRVISQMFPKVQTSVWAGIGDRFHGYQPVGTAQIVATDDARCPWLVYAPTMRIPMRLDHGREVAVHDALWAALLAIEQHNATGARPINVAACPGFGTGFGLVSPRHAARLMATAYDFWRSDPNGSISQRETALEPPEA